MIFSSKSNNILLVILLLILLLYMVKRYYFTICNNTKKEKNVRFSNICQKKFDNAYSPSDIKNIKENCKMINF